MPWNYLSNLLFLSSLVTLLLAWYAWRHRHNQAGFILSVLLGAVAIWLFGYGLELLYDNPAYLKITVIVQYLGVASVPVLYLLFAASYSSYDGWLTRRNIFLLSLLPALFYLSLITNNYHGLFYRAFTAGQVEGFNYIQTEPGIFWTLNLIYAYILILCGFSLFIRMYVSASRAGRTYVTYFIMGSLLPFAANFVYVSGIRPFGFLDLTPIAFMATVIILTIGVFASNLFGTSPLAMEQLFQSIPDPIIVVDRQGHIIAMNPSAQTLNKTAGKEHQDLFNYGKFVPGHLTSAKEDIQLGDRVFSPVIKELIMPGGDSPGSLWVLRDITKRKGIERELMKSEERLRSLVDNLPVGIYRVTPGTEGNILMANPAFLKLFGMQSPDELKAVKMRDLYYDPSDRVKASDRVIREGGYFAAELKLRKMDGSAVYCLDSAKLVCDEDGKALYFDCILEDITERKQAEEALKYRLEFEKLVSAISSNFVNLPPEQLNEGITYALREIGRFFAIDRSYVILFSEDGLTYDNPYEWCAPGVESVQEKNRGFPVDRTPWWVNRLRRREIVHIPDTNLMPPEAAADREDFLSEKIKSILAIPFVWEGKVFGCFGLDSIQQNRSWPDDEISLLSVVAELISEALIRHRNEETIRRLSFHDQLTELYNRHYFVNELNRLEQSREYPISIVSADLDGLKLVNDSLGHTEGDRFLIDCSKALKKSLRGSDVLARVGGDEFAILLPNTPGHECERVIDRIRKNIAAYNSGANVLPISISLGYAVSTGREQSLEDTFRRADARMYEAKVQQGAEARRSITEAIKNWKPKTV